MKLGLLYYLIMLLYILTDDNRPGYTGNIESYLYGEDSSSFKILNRHTGEIPTRVFIRRPFKFLFKILISLSLLNHDSKI